MSNDETPTIAPAAPEGAHLDLQEVFRLMDFWVNYLEIQGVESNEYYSTRSVAQGIISELLSNPNALPRTK